MRPGLLTQCGDSSVPSPEVSNADIRAEIKAVSDGSGTISVHGTLYEDSSGRTLELKSSEMLIVSQNRNTEALFGLKYNLWQRSEDNAEVATLQSSEDDDSYSYIGIFYQQKLNDLFYISFVRTADRSVLNSEVTLPNPFQILSPGSGQTFSRSDGAINVTWDSSGTADDMQIEVDSVCPLHHWQRIEDNGNYPLLLGTSQQESCTVTIVLNRIRPGLVAAEFGKGGYIHGLQQRSVSIISVP